MTFLFYLFAGLATVGGVGVVMSKNPVGSLLFMVTTLAAMAGTFVLLEAHFLAAIQIIVYAGAIMVLFLFVIMLLNLGHDYKADLKLGVTTLIPGVVTAAIGALLATRLVGDAIPEGSAAGAVAIDAAVREYGAVGAIAEPLYTTYVVPFEITGILLLVAIVGAIVLAKRHV